MKLSRRFLGLVCGLALAAPGAIAQTYPSGPIRLVVPFTAGGSTDVVARLVGQKITELTGAQVVIENRGGASGIIGAETVAKARPDGYTLLFATNGILAVNPVLFRKLPYDPLKDFTLVTRVGSVPNILAVNPSVPARSVQELIALAKASPGKLSYGSSGTGGAAHLAVESFKMMAGVDILEVPYKGAAPMATDLIAGQISMTITGIPALQQHVKSGRLRALAVSTARRSAAMPELPTIAESGLPGYDVSSWLAVVAPAGTPPEIVAKLNSVIAAGLKQPDMVERFASEGIIADGGSPEDLARVIRNDIAHWRKLVAAGGLKPE